MPGASAGGGDPRGIVPAQRPTPPRPPSPRNPLLFQLNTRVHLNRLAEGLGRSATLDDLSDEALERLRQDGFDWLYLLGVWRTGPASRAVSRRTPEWRAAFEATLADLRDDDICGSCFAVSGYEVHPQLGGDDALARLRSRSAQRGLRLMLDVVPNHVGLDHPWGEEHPEFFIEGTEADLASRPWDVTRLGHRILAHGRDPHVGGWPDTLQLDYTSPGVHHAMADVLDAVADRCDGIRCDMAMLLLPDVFEATWGRRPEPFWPAAIARLRDRHPSVVLMAEVYWDRERELQQQGFDVTYDKTLYDRLRDADARQVRDHLGAEPSTQYRMARFLENHDERRAATVFPFEAHRVASLVTFLTPGLRFLHEGQREGRRTHVSPHLCRGPVEETDVELAAWYDVLLDLLADPVFREGEWSLVACDPVDQEGSADTIVAWAWQLDDGRWRLVVVNLGPEPGRGRIHLPFDDLAGSVMLEDRLSGARFEHRGDDLLRAGLAIELDGWGAYVFAVDRPTPGAG